MASSHSLQNKAAVDQLLSAIWQLPEEAQLLIADKLKRKTLRSRLSNFIKTAPKDQDMSMEEIVAEVKAVRAARYARRKK